MSQQPIEYPIVDERRALEDVLDRISGAAVLALDTEFVRERTYFPELCVLQIASDNVIAAIDCLAAIDLDPLFDLLLGSDMTWVLHSARQDLEVLFYRTGRLPRTLIDTQIAAGLIGMPSQIGLQGLLSELLEIEIGKQHTRADWSRRPLSDALKQYALDDVRYLLSARQQLEDRLQTLDRLAWFREDCERQLALPIEPDLPLLFDKVKGAGSLRGAHRAGAIALVEWREQRAKSLNRPRRWILADDQLVRIAAALPRSMSELEQVQNLPPRLIARSGSLLLAAMAEAEDIDEVPESNPPDRTLVKQLQSEIRQRAEALGIQPELLATRRDIASAAAGRPPEIVSSGWRRSVLSDLLDGLSRDRES